MADEHPAPYAAAEIELIRDALTARRALVTGPGCVPDATAARLLATLDAYRAIVEAVADIHMFAAEQACAFCDKMIDDDDDEGHLPDCPVTRARALLATSPEQE